MRNCLEVKSKKRAVDCSSVVQHLLSMHKAQGPNIIKSNKNQDPTDLVSGMGSLFFKMAASCCVLTW